MEMMEREREKGRPKGIVRRKSEAHVRRRNEGVGDKKRGYQERTSQVAAKWRIIIVASSVSRILCRYLGY